MEQPFLIFMVAAGFVVKSKKKAIWLNGSPHWVITWRFLIIGWHRQTFFPAARDDVLAAFSWLRTHAQVENLGVFGSSAGGSLAVDVGLAEGVPTVSWSGIFDIQQWFADHPAVVAQPDTKTDFVKTASAEIDQGGRMIHFTSGSF